MIKDKGVYTTKCPTCTRVIVMHVSTDGSISPNKCSECELGFAGLQQGEERNTFVIIPAVKKLNIFGNEKTEEKNETDKKEHTLPIKITRGGKEEETKKIKNSFKR